MMCTRERLVSNGGNGVFVTSSTVYGSSTRALSVDPRYEFCMAPLFASPRSIVNLTSSAVSGSPLWNFTPRRMWKRHVLGFGFSQRSASIGLSVRRSVPVTSTRASKMWTWTQSETAARAPLFAGLSVNGSSPKATTHWSLAAAGWGRTSIVRKRISAVTVFVPMQAPWEIVGGMRSMLRRRSVTE